MYNIIGKTLEVLEKQKDNQSAKERLKKVFILECKFNLGLLDTTRWTDVNDEFKTEICKNLRVDAAKAIYSFTDQNLISAIFQKVAELQDESETENNSEIRIVSLINRIDILTTISSLPESLKLQSRANYKIRIKNLRKLLLDILKEDNL